MKQLRPIIFLFFFFSSFALFAQEEEEITEFPDKEAEFPGGAQALRLFLAENIVYPEISMELGDQGRVFVEFVIEKDGSISNVKVLKGVSPELDAEAARVISIMPKWTPAVWNDKVVRARARIPINFTLTDSNDASTFSKEAEFPNGRLLFYRFAKNNFDFGKIKPKKLKQLAISFTIGVNGELSLFEVHGKASKKEKQRIIQEFKKMPNWTPSYSNGTPNVSTITIPLEVIIE